MKNPPDVLIVDDTLANLKTLATILKEENYKIHPATSGKLALDSINHSLPDLILLDIRMPDMDGYEVCKIIRNMPSCNSIPIIFISALDDVSDKVKAFSMGGNDYIIKPFREEEVKARVATHLKIKCYQDKMEDLVAAALNEINALNHEIIETQGELLFRLSEVCESRSRETGSHVKRVSEFSYLFAKHYGCSNEEAELIKYASPMHDIGKIGIPDSILHKAGKLDPEEWRIMQSHPVLGYEILHGSPRPLIALAAQIAYEHHEKWDGAGYPRQISGNEISLAGRIVACADVLDALSCARCYKPAWEIDMVMTYFREESGKHFDPSLVEILLSQQKEFLNIIDLYQDKL
ncbi:putative two-component system response regulator [Nitrosomonas sp. Nm84]|uniref:response regulator n=1 Tax=Nitrosomonas sp. Nm84 TaxID=200124 RepID=UPI000D7585F7|nr:HD domain-containing phosphohydrolase [Nitrosomonas sp. Nm84]PXW89639.1 putative two-component system response regulator [Nitrosomonas sp. Nm84]